MFPCLQHWRVLKNQFSNADVGCPAGPSSVLSFAWSGPLNSNAKKLCGLTYSGFSEPESFPIEVSRRFKESVRARTAQRYSAFEVSLATKLRGELGLECLQPHKGGI